MPDILPFFAQDRTVALVAQLPNSELSCRQMATRICLTVTDSTEAGSTDEFVDALRNGDDINGRVNAGWVLVVWVGWWPIINFPLSDTAADR